MHFKDNFCVTSFGKWIHLGLLLLGQMESSAPQLTPLVESLLCYDLTKTAFI